MRCRKYIYMLGAILQMLLIPTLFTQEELLKTKDVQQVMQTIFKEHVAEKNMSSDILKHSLRIYIDQFDPNRVYLLESEIKPFIDISDSDLNTAMGQYKNNDLTKFIELNNLFQKAILRSREVRAHLVKEPALLFNNTQNTEKSQPYSDVLRTFPKDAKELNARIEDQLRQYITAEKKRFGEELVIKHQNRTLKLYDNHLETHENEYIYEDYQGKKLSQSLQENLFVTHVLKSLARSLDAHTSIMNPAEAQDMRVRLKKGFQGIGVILQETPEGIMVSKLVENGPAQRSGLVKVNDLIVEVDGHVTEELTVEELATLLKKDVGTTLSITLKRKIKEDNSTSLVEKSFPIKIKSEQIPINEGRVKTTSEKFGNGVIGEIKLDSFYQNDEGISSEKDIRDAIKTLDKEHNLRGLIIDLRENGGGFLTQAVKVSGLFITNGVVVISKYANGEIKYYRDVDPREVFDGPIVILTSKLTASAAEIVAQTLQDYGVAIIVGDERTYGKGSIQSQTVTGDENSPSYLKVTVGKYYTVSGKTPQLVGVKADVHVPSKYSDLELGEEWLEYSLNSDVVPEAYVDNLADVDGFIKPWLLQYYVPTLQKKETKWGNMIPTLKKNSEYRLKNNKDFQLFLTKAKHLDAQDLADNNDDETTPAKNKNTGVNDLQMAEAVNIVKDMILLQTQMYGESPTDSAHVDEEVALPGLTK